LSKGSRLRATLTRISLWIWLIAVASTAAAQQIQFAEPIDPALTSSSAQFDAYGRRFALQLADNQRVLQKLSTQRKQELQSYRLLRGSLEGQPGSWVRLTVSSTGTEGAIWDGHDLYAVTSYQRAQPYLTTPLAVAPQQTVIYRLSDARDVLPRDFCGLGDTVGGAQKLTGLDQYQSMVAQLKDDAGGITRQIEIALIADSAFAAAEAPDPTAAMLARLNIVEGIFAEQVGLLVLATDVRVTAADNDPFTSTQGTTLLEQLGRYRAADPLVRARGLAHLMTGKNLDGSTAGIAYVDTACDVERGVSLSERSYGTTISALIMAHELGHNFGAPHDGESGACAAVSGGFIMAPSVSGFVTFSQCSIDVMQASLQRASCVTPASYADVSLESDLTNLAAEGGAPFTLPFTVRSTGTNPVDEVAYTLTLPDNAGLTLDSVSAEGGNCSVAGLTAQCEFGTLASGEQRAVSVTAHGTLAGNIVARGRVSASNDRLITDNSHDVTVAMRSGIDAALTVSTDQQEVALGAPLTIYTELRSLRALPVRNAVLSLNLNQAVRSASMPGANCTVNPSSVICTVAELVSGAALRLTVTTNTTTAGPLFAAGSVTAVGDGDFSNNSDHAHAWVQADRDVELTAGPASVTLDVGGAYEIPFLVRSRGPQSTGDVTLSISLPASALVVEALDADGATCSETEAARWSCPLGAIAPGEARLVRMRVHGSKPATVDVNAVADTADDGYLTNNSAATQLRIDNLVDVGVILASGGSGLEDDVITGQVVLRAGGRQAATNATFDVELNAAGVLRAVSIHEGATCELLSAQHARCALPVMARGAQLYVNYSAVFAEAGTYDVKFALHVPGDTAADNDTLVRPVLVRPYYDVGVAGSFDLSDLVVGGSRDSTFTVTATRRTLPNARFTAVNYLPALRVAAIHASAGECSVDAEVGGVCDFTDLTSDTGVAVTVTWAAEAVVQEDVAVAVSTASDVVPANNTVKGRAEVLAPTDVELRVDAAIGGIRGAMLNLPPISIVNGGNRAIGTRLEIKLPAEVALVSVSAANALCSGTTELRCDFATLEANSTSTVNISVRPGAGGSYLGALKLSTVNDNNPANDARELRFEISDSPAPAPAKGGGGGSFEWLSLLLLALLKWGQAPFAGKKCRS
jgi:Reprolysin (M12B) family zinc metalloprotease/Domain of unknown function DUF11